MFSRRKYNKNTTRDTKKATIPVPNGQMLLQLTASISTQNYFHLSATYLLPFPRICTILYMFYKCHKHYKNVILINIYTIKMHK